MSSYSSTSPLGVVRLVGLLSSVVSMCTVPFTSILTQYIPCIAVHFLIHCRLYRILRILMTRIQVLAAFEARMNDRAETDVIQLLEDSVDTINTSAANSNSPARYGWTRLPQFLTARTCSLRWFR